MEFCEQLWAESVHLRRAIHAHPFNQELAAGTLSRDAFAHYMVQDSLYLRGYAKILALAAAKAPSADDILACAKAAQTAIVVERALHAGYLDQFGISAAKVEAAEPTPACDAYVNYMLAVAATESYAVLMAAILPCFWLYQDVGTQIAKSTTPDNFYQAWIDTYSDADFAAATQTMKAIVEAAAQRAGETERDSMIHAFLRCAQYEWMFWDSAYTQSDWPIKP